MPPTNVLTDAACRGARPKDRPYKLFDGAGLYLEVLPSGSRSWRMKYRVGGKEKRLSIGLYPTVGLKDARQACVEARAVIAAGGDPAAAKRARKSGTVVDSFESIAREWVARFAPGWAESHRRLVVARLENNVYPWLGGASIASIDPPDVLAVVRRIESRGALQVAHRTLRVIGQIMRYAVATGRAKRDPTADLRGALPPARGRHFAALTDADDVAALVRAIDGYQGTLQTRVALRLSALLFQRPGEIRAAEWAEFDLDGALWRIPALKMKMREDHHVPLPVQAVELLREIEPLTGRERYVFGSLSHKGRPMSENTVLGALRRLGYEKGTMTAHGFRALARSRLAELGWNPDAIERQLAHRPAGSLGGAYDRAQFMDERRRMMQAWADYLDALRSDSKVTPIHARLAH